MAGGPDQIDPGAWWDPRNWSVGGQKILGGGNAPSSTPMANGGRPYAGSTPKAVAAAAGNPDLRTSTSQQTDKDVVDADAAWLRAFRDSMNAPLDFNDPYVKNILGNARQTTLTSANNAGIFGPYSQNMAEQAYVKGAAGLQQQNRAMALQAASMATGVDQNTRNFNYDVTKDKYTNDMDIWKYNEGKNSGLAGLAGGGLGAIVGGLAAGPEGASAGYKLGSGIGSMFGRNAGPPPPKFNPGY